MKEEMIQRVKKGKTAGEILNLLREELHHIILQEVDRQGGFEQICFVGGTALRILYGLDRFSEDLDFSTSTLSEKKFDLSLLASPLQQSLEAFGFDCQVQKLNKEKTVQSCLFSFSNLLFLANRSFRKEQKLAIKFEVDTRPPMGGVEIFSPVTTMRLYKVRHYELPSLFAGKLNAILCRKFTKGRDLYDFLWYMGRHVPVNLTLLENGIEQMEGKKPHLSLSKLQQRLADRFSKIDFQKAQQDVASFLVHPDSSHLFDKQVFLDALRQLAINP